MSVSDLYMYKTCPPGLTSINGSACNSATCNSTFVAPDARVAKPASDKQCASCDAGFGGINCNICQTPDACQTRKSSLGLRTPDSLFGSNQTLICHKQPSAVRTTYIDCNVRQATVNGVFSGEMRMTLSKTYKPDSFSETGLASWPADANTALSQVWLDGIEQFYCQAAGCTAKNSTSTLGPQGDASLGSSLWTCTSLQCYCIPGTTMCGNGQLDLSPVINNLNGTLTMPCDYVDPTNATATSHCAFRGELLNNFLGPDGLPLESCQFGSCITQSELDAFYATGYGQGDSIDSASSLSNAVIVGLVILGIAVVAIAGLLLLGLWQQIKARKMPKGAGRGPVGLQWEHLNYTVPSKLGLRRRMRKSENAHLAQVTPSSDFDESVAHLDSGKYDLRVVRNSSGRIGAGCMVAVLGPSGAGKTSLVELLAGRHKVGRVSGNISATEAFVEPGFEAVSSRRAIGFVDQEDALPAFSTVREALQMAADLSLPDNVSKVEKHEIVASVIQQLGLERVANKRIGDASRRGLSGGERRRVSIGYALVSRPRLLIADEPLSGLDAFSAARVISAFRQLATGPRVGGTTVIVTIHQPSSEIFYSFDQVMLMSQGAVIYHGSPSDSLAWCERQGEQCPVGHNVADHLLKIASSSVVLMRSNAVGEKPEDEGVGKLRSSEGVRSCEVPPVSALPSNAISAGSSWEKRVAAKSMVTFITQFSTLCRRNFITARRDPAAALSHIVGSIIIGLVVGGCFYQVKLTIAGFQNRVGSMYFLFILLAFSALSSATAFTKARPLMMRERANGLYGPFAWLFSYVVYDAVLLRIIPAILLSTAVYWMVGMEPKANYFLEFVLISILFHLGMALQNMILAAVIEDLSISILIAGMYILFNIGFGGFLLNLNNLPGVFRWLQWICPMKYALEAVASHELDGLKLVDTVGGVSITASVSVFSGNLFAFESDAFYRDLLVLSLGFVLGNFVALAVAVAWKVQERR
ncbi:related to ADP1 - ABC transporter [Melanopsichium pennsylvanicum]|uniref:Related to ADP1 - ABC transporter n=2 Tax=Melanopsichium pennsylvanicum TaxID=63383 RepID=A0AAJ5C846_9BASI|nr:related to ADP1-ABC transporter [Melanopsichium pennsylvanicum 4]SNX87602.1 related to ADP1 - ABC transporter [Melanopsichium pennsylvanicum]